MKHFLNFSIMSKIFLSILLFGLSGLTAPVASAYGYVDGWTYEPVTQYENYNYGRVIYDSPEEYWIKSSPYYSTTHALHPYWRNSYNEYREYRPSFIRSNRFSNYLVDAYERGYLGSLSSVQPLELPRGPALQARCMNYTLKQRTSRVPAQLETCDSRRSGTTPLRTNSYGYDYYYGY